MRDACRKSCGLCVSPSLYGLERFPTSFRALARPAPPSIVLTMLASGSMDDFEDLSVLQRNVAALAGVKLAAIDTLIAADAQVNSVLITATISVLDLMTAAAVQVSLSSALSSSDAATMWLGTVIESTPKVVVRNSVTPTMSGGEGDHAGWTAPLTAASPSRVLDDESLSAAEAEVNAAEMKAAAEAGAQTPLVEYRMPLAAPLAPGAKPFPYPPKVPLADGEKITIVIISDRLQPLSAAIGSIVLHSTAPLQIYIIAYEAGELQATLTRTLPLKPGQSLEVLAMDTVTAQLVETSFEPVWVWDEYGESTGNSVEAWRTEHTVQQEMWDHDPMHSSPFNHLRFYLPYLPFLAGVDHLIFLDDDVIVQGEIAEMVVQMPPGKVIAAPCDTWVWGDACSQFTFVANATDWRRNSAVLYLNSAWRSCGSDEACKISAYEATIQEISRNATGKEIDLSRQPVRPAFAKTACSPIGALHAARGTTLAALSPALRLTILAGASRYAGVELWRCHVQLHRVATARHDRALPHVAPRRLCAAPLARGLAILRAGHPIPCL